MFRVVVPTSDTELLTHFTQMLRNAEARVRELRDAEAEAAELRPIVEGLQQRVARLGSSAATAPAVDTGDEGEAAEGQRASDEPSDETGQSKIRRRRGGKPIIVALREITAEGGEWTVDDIMAALDALPEFAGVGPKRVSVTNRLNELVNEQWLQSPRRGEYKRVPPNGSASSVDAGGADQTEPNSGVIPLDGADLDSRPPEGPDQPLGWTPGNGATAGAAGGP